MVTQVHLCQINLKLAQLFLTRFFKFFILVGMATRTLHGMEILKADYPRIIPVKLGEIPPSDFGDVI